MTGTNAGFAAGTLVHTKNGLMPIEQLKVGDLALSQSEPAGEQSYRPVVSIRSFENRIVGLLAYYREEEKLVEYIVVTGDFPFYVAEGSPYFNDKRHGWTPAQVLTNGDKLPMSDGRRATVWEYRDIRNTETPGLSWVCERKNDYGYELDFRSGRPVLQDKLTCNIFALDVEGGWTETTVYNIEVDGATSYFLGELGVCVHACSPA